MRWFFVIVLAFPCLVSDSYGKPWDIHRFEFTEAQMGTEFRIILYAEDENRANQLARRAFDRVAELNSIFSDYDSGSEISRLTGKDRVGQLTPVSNELHEVLHFAQRLSKKTKGAFDVTIGPLSKLWRRAFRRNEFPDQMQIKKAHERVGYRQLRSFRRRNIVLIRKQDLKLDFGGIAKGYAVDEIAAILDSAAVIAYLVDGGGDLYAGPSPPARKGWEIALPSGKSLILANSAIAVSGDQYKFLLWNNRKYSHIIDPRTGLGTTHQITLGVIASNCMAADAWASALSVLGPGSKSERIIRKNKNEITVHFFQNE